MTSFVTRAFAAILCVLGAAVASARDTQWTIVDLGALGPNGSFATSVNERGDVVGFSAARVPGQQFPSTHAFLWQNGTMMDLGTPAGSTFSTAVAVNNEGTIAGADGSGNAYLWRDGAWIPLNIHGGPADVDSGDAVTGTFSTASGLHSYLFRNGDFQDLGTLGGSDALAASMNEAGAVVGNSSLAGNATSHGFLWEDGVLKDVGTLGGQSSTAVDVNNGGVVVGASQDASGRLQGFIYDSTQGIRPLFQHAGAFFAAGINDRGAVIGFIDANSFLYEDGALTTLESIPEVRAAGWTKLFPMDINNRGWIAGLGQHANGAPNSAFLLMPR